MSFGPDGWDGRGLASHHATEGARRVPRAVYHLLDRGDRCEAIFRDEADRERFLGSLGEVAGRTGWRVHAFVLMTNHYHLLVETPQANLVGGMRWIHTTYALRFNRRPAYGKAVPERVRTTSVSPLLTKPSVFTSERKLIASAV